MNADAVLQLYDYLQAQAIAIWIDGGWCVDALLGRQTREHSDLDIAIARKDNATFRKAMQARGYHEEKRDDATEWNYVLKNDAGEQVDVHVFEYGANNENTYGVQYPYGSLTGTGTINGQEVACISPEWMFRFKTAYPPKQKDLADVRALAEKFGFEIPASHHS